MVRRKEGWELRLYAVIDAALAQPYKLGTHDCTRLACAVVEALTSEDHWPRLAGYRTRRQALARIATFGHTLGDAVSAILTVAPAPTFSARRGDIVLFRDDRGEDHLGICLGHEALVTAEHGALMLSITDKRLLNSWRVG